MGPQLVSLVSACTALVASIAGPLATFRVSRRQFDAMVLSASRQKWIDALRDSLADLMSQLAGLSVLKPTGPANGTEASDCSRATRRWSPGLSAWFWFGGRSG
jgi:hypothetical protein